MYTGRQFDQTGYKCQCPVACHVAYIVALYRLGNKATVLHTRTMPKQKGRSLRNPAVNALEGLLIGKALWHHETFTTKTKSKIWLLQSDSMARCVEGQESVLLLEEVKLIRLCRTASAAMPLRTLCPVCQ